MSDPIRAAVYRLGGPVAVARSIGVSRHVVHAWMRSGRVPYRRVLPLAKAAGAYPHQLTPGFPVDESVALTRFWEGTGSWGPYGG